MSNYAFFKGWLFSSSSSGCHCLITPFITEWLLWDFSVRLDTVSLSTLVIRPKKWICSGIRKDRMLARWLLCTSMDGWSMCVCRPPRSWDDSFLGISVQCAKSLLERMDIHVMNLVNVVGPYNNTFQILYFKPEKPTKRNLSILSFSFRSRICKVNVKVQKCWSTSNELY